MGKQLTAELLNDKIVTLRKVVKIAERNLVEKIDKNLKTTKDVTDAKRVRRAGRMKEERAFITEKKVDADEVAKFALLNTKSLVELNIQPNTNVRDRVLYKLATEKVLLNAVDKIREDYPNWSKEIPFHLQRLGKRSHAEKTSELEDTLAAIGKKKASADDGPAAKRAKVVEPESDEEEESEDEDIEVDEAEDEEAEDEEDEAEGEDEDEDEEEVAPHDDSAQVDSDADDQEELPYAQRFAKVQKKKLVPAEDSGDKNTKSKPALGLIDDMAEEEDMDEDMFEDAMFGAEDASDEDELAEAEDDESVESMEVDELVEKKKPIVTKPVKAVDTQKGKNVPAKGAKGTKNDSTAFVKKVKLDDLVRAQEKIPTKKKGGNTQDAKMTSAPPKGERKVKKFLAKDSDESEESEEELAIEKKPVQKKGFWKGKVSDDESEEDEASGKNQESRVDRKGGRNDFERNRGRGGFNQGRGRGGDNNRGNFRGRGRGGDNYRGNFRGRGSGGDNYRGNFRGRGDQRGGFRGRGSGGDHHRGGFRGRGGDSGGFRGRGGGFRGHGGSPGRGGGGNRGRGNQQRGGRFNANEEKVHPSWAARQQQKAGQGGTPQGKRIVFDD